MKLPALLSIALVCMLAMPILAFAALDSFSGVPSTGNAPLMVTYTGTLNTGLSCNASSYTISYGDNNAFQIDVPAGLCTAKLFSIIHTYAAVGTYNVGLYKGSIAQVQAGQYTTIQIGAVVANTPKPVVPETFSGTPSTGTAPLSVTFTGTVNGSQSCDASSYTVSYGDNKADQIDVPVGRCSSQSFTLTHIYSNTGMYSVGLYRGSISQVQSGSYTTIQTGAVNVSPAPTYTPISVGTANPYYDVAPKTIFPSKNAILPKGITYSDTVPDTLDLAERALWFIRGATQSVMPSLYYAPANAVFKDQITGETSCSTVPCLYNGSPNWGKIQLALARAREMSGYDRTDTDGTLNGQYVSLINMLDYGANYNLMIQGIPGIVVPTKAITPTTVAMEALMAYYEEHPENNALRSAINEFVRMHKATITDTSSGSYFYNDTDTNDSEQGTMGNWSLPAFVQGRAGIALANWSAQNTDASSMLSKLVSYLLDWQGGILWKTPNASLYPSESGQFVGQIHSNLQPVLAMLSDAEMRRAKNPSDVLATREIEQAKATYEFVKRRTRPGLIGDFGEIGTTGDMIRIGIKLTELGAGNYLDEVEAWTRNQLAEGQIDASAAAYIPNYSRSSYETTNVGTKSQGLFFSDATHIFSIPLNKNFRINIDGPANAMRAMYEVWAHTLTLKNGVARVNFLLNRAGIFADVKSDLPYRGRIAINMKPNMSNITALEVRIPNWADKAQVRVTAQKNAVETPLAQGTGWSWDGVFVRISGPEANTSYVVSFPVVISTQTVIELRSPNEFWYEGSYPTAAGPEQDTSYKVTFRGDTAVDVSPRPVGGVPRYQRSVLANLGTQDAPAPLKTVERFVFNGESAAAPIPTITFSPTKQAQSTSSPSPAQGADSSNSVSISVPNMSAAPVPQARSCVQITRTLSLGSHGPDVVQLQRYLISQDLLAPGNDTGYFGSLTQAAVQAYQRREGIVSYGTPLTTGYGVVGARTRAALARCS